MIVKQDYVYNATIVDITDGDTVVLDVDFGCDEHRIMKCRLDGINTPELNTAAGKEAKAWFERTHPVGTKVVAQTIKDKTEKYGRYLVVLYRNGFDASINDSLVSLGLAKPYHGGKR